MQLLLFYWMPLIYLIIINLTAFFAMRFDKRKARQNEWRVTETTLHIIGFIGGAIGIFAGMLHFRHKTQKKSFKAIALIALLISFFIYWLTLIIYIP